MSFSSIQCTCYNAPPLLGEGKGEKETEKEREKERECCLPPFLLPSLLSFPSSYLSVDLFQVFLEESGAKMSLRLNFTPGSATDKLCNQVPSLLLSFSHTHTQSPIKCFVGSYSDKPGIVLVTGDNLKRK